MVITQAQKQTVRWGTIIRQKRRRLGLSQGLFGAMFGVSHAAVSEWENGKSDPPGSVTYWLYLELAARSKK